MLVHIVAVLCVVGLAIGQILFKASANSYSETGSLFATKTLVTLFIAFSLYGIVTCAWVWTLQKIELGRIYPVMALAFVLVPLGSHLAFGERFSPQYIVGVVLIVLGIVTSVKS